MRIGWSPEAIQSREEIRTYYEQFSHRAADRVVRRLRASTRRLGRYPQSGRIVPEFASEELREVIEPPFRVIYQVTPTAVEIVTVRHSAQHLS